MEEIWKPAKGFEGYLEVSTKGNVRSVDRVITVKDGSRIYNKPVKGKGFVYAACGGEIAGGSE